MAKGWKKKNCYVVHAWYRDELYQKNATPMKEEDVVLSYAEAERLKAEYESDPDFEKVYIEEDEREFWVDIEEIPAAETECPIKELRKRIGMDQSAFSEYTGIPVGTISNWEQRRRTPPIYIINLLERLINAESADKQK